MISTYNPKGFHLEIWKKDKDDEKKNPKLTWMYNYKHEDHELYKYALITSWSISGWLDDLG